MPLSLSTCSKPSFAYTINKGRLFQASFVRLSNLLQPLFIGIALDLSLFLSDYGSYGAHFRKDGVRIFIAVEIENQA